ncbi:hypothetical protein CDL12_21675 [Handroanthus impetiginosus]|uniref:Uncharacterized protein n=1 Tax=Handroanthus impetiginosus TaxID=429701 RepID=A0A2G9GKF7_9LAMI|nr:hypothetical protein CDL12_21675 [Handroanthus impetiginosus]
MNDLVFVKYNRALRRHYNLRDTIDPISLDKLDDSNEWLVGENDRLGENSDEEMFDDDLTRGHISKASGAEEPAYFTREKNLLRKLRVVVLVRLSKREKQR